MDRSRCESYLSAVKKGNRTSHIVEKFFEQNYPVFVNALEDAFRNQKGLLEAAEVAAPQPLDLSKTTSFSNLMNCHKDGILIYQQTAFRQIEMFAGQEGLPGKRF